MYSQVEKPKENKNRAVANSVAQNKSNGKQGFTFEDNRVNTLQLFKPEEEDSLKEAESLLWIDLENSRWIPNGALLNTDGTPINTEDYSRRFTRVINEGWPIPISDLMNVVPSNATNNWVPEKRIQVGFKYEFTDSDSVKWVVRGHAPELKKANYDEIGTLFWTVRIQRANEHLLSKPVPIDVKQTKFNQWVRRLKGDRLRLAHIVATPN